MGSKKLKQDNFLPEVYQYLDFREFIRDRISAIQDAKDISFRSMSKVAGFKSPNHIQLIISGEKGLSNKSIEQISSILELSKTEKRFFENLVYFGQAKEHIEKQKYYERILNSKKFKMFRKLAAEQYNYFSKWYYIAIRELINLPFFINDAKWIGQMLTPQVPTKDIEHAIRDLIQMGILKEEGGELIPVHGIIDTGYDARKMHVLGLHIANAEIARSALDICAVDEREFGSLTIAMSEADFSQIRQLQRDFIRKAIDVIENSEASQKQRIYQMNLQLFPLSKKVKRSSE